MNMNVLFEIGRWALRVMTMWINRECDSSSIIVQYCPALVSKLPYLHYQLSEGRGYHGPAEVHAIIFRWAEGQEGREEGTGA
jgi:hypothetical protein